MPAERQLQLNADSPIPRDAASPPGAAAPAELHDQPSLPGSCDFLENQAEAAMHASRLEVRRMVATLDNGNGMEISWPPPQFSRVSPNNGDENPHLRSTSQSGSASSSDPVANPQCGELGIATSTSTCPLAGHDEELKVRARWTSAMWFAAQEAQRRRDRLMRRLSFKSDQQADRPKGPEALCRAIANSKIMSFMVGISTLWVLYGMDVYFLTDPPVSYDKTLYAITFVCFLFLSTDFCLSTWFKAQYFNSFYFYLDLIAIMSVIPDVMWLFSQSNNSLTTQVGFLAVARAARAARASTSASRVIRLLPMLKKSLKRNRQVNPMQVPQGSQIGSGLAVSNKKKSAKASKQRRRSGSISVDGQPLIDATEPGEEGIELHSKIGRDLDAIVSTHMIMVVGVQFLISIFLSFLFTLTRTSDVKAQMKMLSISHESCLAPSCDSFMQAFDVFRKHQADAGTPLLFLSLSGTHITGDVTEITRLRQHPQKAYIELNVTVDDGYAAIHLLDKTTFRNSLIENILTITTVIGVLVAASASLATFIRLEAVVPMERMISTIQELAVNPLKPLRSIQTKSTHNETSMVEQALVKFGSLLQLGFGEAGAKIITGNMKNGRVDATLPGKVTQAIFGFCDIRNFTDCTEVLQGDVVKLVNGIAQYVHTAVKDNYGAPNKNIGDAFLLVWKPKGSLSLSEVATSALRSYVRTILAISRCSELCAYANNPKLQERMPGFKVKMGFGLHYGWAIEGAIGSAQKIDASYLSPHVNIASRLEACTKQYGVAILISQHLHSLLNDNIKPLCRMVDRVTLKGSVVPMFLFTYDVPDASEDDDDDERWEVDGTDACDPRMDLATFFFKAAPPAVSTEFRDCWDMVMNAYLGGPSGALANWKQAAVMLKKCLQIRPEDGPSQTLLDVIKTEGDEGGNALRTWKGYRNLKEK